MLYQVADNTNDRRNLAKIESRRKAAFSTSPASAIATHLHRSSGESEST